MSNRQTPRAWILGLAIFALLFTGPNLFAEATTFRNGGLKNETIVTLEVKGKTATGTFVSYEYGEDVGPGSPFTGKVRNEAQSPCATSAAAGTFFRLMVPIRLKNRRSRAMA